MSTYVMFEEDKYWDYDESYDEKIAVYFEWGINKTKLSQILKK